MNSEILSVEVALRGIEKVQEQLDGLADKFQDTEGVIEKVAADLGALTVVIGVLAAGINQAAENEVFEARLEGLVGSAKEVEKQMEILDKVARKGIFQEQEVFEAIHAMDKFGISVEKSIGLVEKLGARGGSIRAAAELVGAIEGGMTMGLSRRLRSYGITPDALKEQGVQFSGKEITSAPSEIIKALERIEEMDKSLEKLSGTLTAQWQGLKYDVMEIVEGFGKPFITALSIGVGLVKTLAGWFRELDDITNGWVSNFIAGGLLLVGIEKVASLMKVVYELTKGSAIWTGIQSAIVNSQLIGGIWNAVKGLGVMVLGWFEAAIFAAAAAAAVGNFIPLGLVIAGAALIGAGLVWGGAAIGGAITGGGAGNRDDAPPQSPAGRPTRRDDVERVMKRAYGNAWTG
jgi:hypothetical protein